MQPCAEVYLPSITPHNMVLRATIDQHPQSACWYTANFRNIVITYHRMYSELMLDVPDLSQRWKYCVSSGFKRVPNGCTYLVPLCYVRFCVIVVYVGPHHIGVLRDGPCFSMYNEEGYDLKKMIDNFMKIFMNRLKVFSECYCQHLLSNRKIINVCHLSQQNMHRW